MDTPPGGGMVGVTPWDYEFTVNPHQVIHSFDFGIGEPDITDINCYSNDFEDQFQFDHQSQTSFSFTSLLQDFETDNAFAEYQENLLKQQSNFINQQPDMVQNHVVSCGEGEEVMGDLAPNPSAVHDHGLSPEEEKAMLEFTPTLEDWEIMMEALAPNSSMVHDHVLSSDEATVQLMPAPNVVHDHVISSTDGNLMTVEGTPTSVALHGHAVSHEKVDVVENARDLINIMRPRLTYCNGANPRVRWTPVLHALFVSSVKQLGGCETSVMYQTALEAKWIAIHFHEDFKYAYSATPERILSLMDVPGLTRFHIKSHLQKYRNGGCWLVDGFDRSERAARRASLSHSNAPTRKVQRKRKAKSKARS